MCFMSTPDMPAQPQERQTARAPDQGDPTARQSDLKRRRLAMASSIFTSPTLGMPSVAAPSLGA
jgi:hypothetical protein